MFKIKCGWCREDLNHGDELLIADEKAFHVACLTLYRMYCKEILRQYYLRN